MTVKVPSYIYDCWNCSSPGIPHVASSYICPRCDVTWLPSFAGGQHTLPDRIAYCGVVLQIVDFADPATISSPA
jgi:hypothetical protein